MKLSALVILTSCLTIANAAADDAAWERLYIWYAYQIDGGDPQSYEKTIAADCAWWPNRCSFAELMRYLNVADDIDYSKFNGVDLGDPQSAAEAIQASGVIGPYRCDHIFLGDDITQGDVHGTFQRLNTFMQAKIDIAALDDLSDNDQAALEQVAQAVYTTRVQLATRDEAVWLSRNKGVTLITTKAPSFEGADINRHSVDVPDYTATKNRGGVSDAQMRANGKEYAAFDGQTGQAGHKRNARAAKIQAKIVNRVCKQDRKDRDDKCSA